MLGHQIEYFAGQPAHKRIHRYAEMPELITAEQALALEEAKRTKEEILANLAENDRRTQRALRACVVALLRGEVAPEEDARKVLEIEAEQETLRAKLKDHQ